MLESEKKLRLRRIISKFPDELIVGNHSVKAKNEIDVKDFVPILDLNYLQNFENTDHGSFLYVAGYGAHSTLKFINCEYCRDLIIKGKGISTDVEYFDKLQRGGLIVPTENSYYTFSNT